MSKKVTWSTEELQTVFDVLWFSYNIVGVVRKEDDQEGTLQWWRDDDGNRVYGGFVAKRGERA